MNTAIVSESRSSAGIGFAVPVDTINTAVPGLIRRGNRGNDGRPVLGIIAAPEPVARMIGTEGVVVETVQPGSGAERAGLRSMEYDAQRRPVADVITSVAGQRVTKVDEIWEVMGDHKPGDVVTVEVLRAGKQMRFEVTLREGS
jgi:S1-C subfamily serine protease